MIAFDTNFVVYAHRADVPQHAIASSLLLRVVEDGRPWALPWPCVHEFFAVATNSKLWAQPMAPLQALSAMHGLLQRPGANVIGEGVEHLEILERFVRRGQVRGGMIHNARVAAICLAHGVNEIWTADRDFSRFPELKTYNPFQETHGRHRH